MADMTKIMQLFEDVRTEVGQEDIEPSTVSKIRDGRTAQTALQLIRTYTELDEQPMPKTYEDLAKIIKIQTKVRPEYKPEMGTAEYVAKSVYSKLVEKPVYALGEGSAAALEAGARAVGLKGIANYFKESKEMWKTPPATEDVNEQFAWLLESAKGKSKMHGMVVEMAEIGAQIGSLLIQMGVLGKVPGVKGMDISVFKGTAPVSVVKKQMATMFAHGVATTPGDLSTRLTAGITRMAYNMTPYIANWTGATGWGARAVDMGLNMFLTSPSYIKNVKDAKNPMEFIMMAMPQFMTDFIFALNTTGTPMNQRLKAMGQKPSVFGQKIEEKEAFLRGVDKAIGETQRPYGEEAPEPTKKQVVDSAVSKAKVNKAQEGVLDVYREKPATIKWTKDIDMWYPSEKAGIAIHILGPPATGTGRYIIRFVNERTQETFAASATNIREAKKVFQEIKGYYDKVNKGEPLPTELAGGRPLVVSKLAPKKITVGEKPGIMLTKTEHKKRLALTKKAVASAKIDALIDPINRGRKLPPDSLPMVKQDKDFFEKVGYGWAVLHLGNMRPERMFEEIDGFERGPNTKVGYIRINEAANNEIEGTTNMTEAFKGAITKLGFIDNLDRFCSDRKSVGSIRTPLTKTELVEIYMNMQTKQGTRHLTKARALNGMGFTKADLADVKTEVEADPQMKGLVDWRFREYERWYVKVAPIYFIETGKVLPKTAYYSPIMVQKEFLDFEKESFAQELFDRFHIDGYIEKGFTKARKAGASQPIKLDAIANHMYNISRMQHYINFALPLKEFRGVMNNPRWRKAVTDAKGEVFYSNIKKYYDAVAGTKPSGADEVANKAMGFLRTNAGTAMLGFNLLTAMRQPLSAFQAMAEVGPSYVLNGIKQMMLDPKGIEKFVYERSKMVKYRQGQFERFMTETEVTLFELLGKPRAPKALTGRRTTRDRAMVMAIFMDKNTVLATWKAAYDRVQMTGKTLDGEKIPIKDLEKAACMEADLAVRRTQPMATVKDLPAWHRSSSFLKLFTMFQNQINNNYNYFAHDIIGKVRVGKITPVEAAQKTLFAYILPAMLLGMIARGGLPRDKKQIAEDLIAFPTSGLFFAGGIINAMVKGYSDYGIPPLQFAPDLVKAVTSKKWATKGKFGLKGMAEVTGIPYNQFARTWKGMQALMAGETDDWRRLIWSAYSLEKGLPKPVKGGLKTFKRKE